jgi:hypothetical protein
MLSRANHSLHVRLFQLMQFACGCRVPAATLALLVDTNDPECLEVRHCMNNSCDQHALPGGNAGHTASGTAAAEVEEDVLKLPFFLIPRIIGPHVAKRMLRHRRKSTLNLSACGGFGAMHAIAPPTQGMHADVVNGSRATGCLDVQRDSNSVSRCSARETTRVFTVSRGRTNADACGACRGEGSLGGSSEEADVWEKGSFWEVQESQICADFREAGSKVAAAEDNECMVKEEEARELVVEVYDGRPWTLGA